jgi:hypothetical protein
MSGREGNDALFFLCLFLWGCSRRIAPDEERGFPIEMESAAILKMVKGETLVVLGLLAPEPHGPHLPLRAQMRFVRIRLRHGYDDGRALQNHWRPILVEIAAPRSDG